VTFSQRRSLLLSDPLLLLFLPLLSLKLFLVLFPSFVFLDHCFSVLARLSAHAEIQEVVQVVSVFSHRMNIKLDLSIELRNKCAMNRVFSWFTEQTLVNHHLKSISLEKVKEILCSATCHDFLLGPHFLSLISALLEITALGFVSSAFASSLHFLGLHELGLFGLSEKLLVLIKFPLFEQFNRFNLCKF
jgi:hypothetical protein